MKRQLNHPLHFNAGEAEFFHDLAVEQVNAISPEWISFEGVGKVGAVEEFAGIVKEGGEMHDLFLDGTYILYGDQQSGHLNLSSYVFSLLL